MSRLEKWKRRAASLKTEVYALYLALGHPRTPLAAKVVIVLVVAYAMSPLDLIPDFIPVLGLLDDIVVVPLGILLAWRMIPPEVLEECRRRAGSDTSGRPFGIAGAAVVVLLWILAVVLVVRISYGLLG